MIVLEPQGGLGNRLRAIHSAVQLSKATGHSLIIRWVERKGMMCLYKDLFSESDEFSVRDIRRNIFNRGLSLLLPGRVRGKFNDIRHDIVLYNQEIQKALNRGTDILTLLENKNKIFIRTHLYFIDGDNGFYVPSPSEKISFRVQDMIQPFHDNTVGVHIRGTDNRKSKEMSPVSLFVDRMEQELSHSPDTLFYLSTDSEAARRTLLTHFGESRILFQRNIELSRNSRKGIEDAYVDMLCLSKTKLIIGSHWSSFSAVAASIGGIDKETLITGR